MFQLEVRGDVTTTQLQNLISQTEYALSVTPVYDEGRGQTMLADAVTGEKKFPGWTGIKLSSWQHPMTRPSPLSVDVVPAPKNLRFSEITQTSFRATWDHGAPDVALYRIGWSKRGENSFQYVRENQLLLDFCTSNKSYRYFLMNPTEDFKAIHWKRPPERLIKTRRPHRANDNRSNMDFDLNGWKKRKKEAAHHMCSVCLSLIRPFLTTTRPQTSWWTWSRTRLTTWPSPPFIQMNQRARIWWATREHVRSLTLGWHPQHYYISSVLTEFFWPFENIPSWSCEKYGNFYVFLPL